MAEVAVWYTLTALMYSPSTYMETKVKTGPPGSFGTNVKGIIIKRIIQNSSLGTHFEISPRLMVHINQVHH